MNRRHILQGRIGRDGVLPVLVVLDSHLASHTGPSSEGFRQDRVRISSRIQGWMQHW